MEPRYISVIGGGLCDPADDAKAEEVGRLIAEAGATLVCGGLGGVMEAAARGAQEAGGVTIGILPGHDRAQANPNLDHVLTTGLGHARNLAVVSSGDAVIAVGGGYGTLSEIGLAAAIGRPVVILGGWRLENDPWSEGIFYAASAQEAIAHVYTALGIAAKIPGPEPQVEANASAANQAPAESSGTLNHPEAEHDPVDDHKATPSP